MPLSWGASPPSRLPMSYIRLLVIKPGQAFRVSLLGPALGLLCHWVKPRTLACLGEEECQYHDEPLVWKGFAPALWVGSPEPVAVVKWRPTVVVVTEEIAADVGACAIGTIAVISRPGSAANSPLKWETTRYKVEIPAIKKFDVEPYVCRAMGIPQEKGGELRLRHAQ